MKIKKNKALFIPILIGFIIFLLSFFTSYIYIENKQLVEHLILTCLESNITSSLIIAISSIVIIVKLVHKSPKLSDSSTFEDKTYIKIIEALQGTYFYCALLLCKYSILTLFDLRQYFSTDINKTVILALLIFSIIPIAKEIKDIGEYLKAITKSSTQENKDGEDVEAIN